MPDIGEKTATILGFPTDALKPGEVEFALICAVCGRGITVRAKGEPQSASELVALAERHRMPHVLDFERGRVALFCTDEHAKIAMTKDGKRLKVRIPKVEA